MTHRPEQVAAVTTHRRRGGIRHSFRYGVDYVLIDPEVSVRTPLLFSRNRLNLASVHDRDHGGPAGRDAARVGCEGSWPIMALPTRAFASFC